MSQVGPDIPGFEFREHLGEGGFAHVYLYWQPSLSTNVAIKILKPGVAEMEYLRDEAQAMGRLGAFGHHPHVVAVRQTGEVAGRPFLVMEYCPHGSLKRQLAKGPLPIRDVLRIGVQIASALAAAHSTGTTHLDIKPDNILIASPGRYKLSDFGIALRSTDGRRTLLGYSPRYAAPEVMLGQAADPPADLYSLAATLYTLLAGRPPFVVAGGDNSDAAVERRATAVAPVIGPISDVPESLTRLLRAAMARDPDERTRRVASVRDFAQRLQAIEQAQAYPVTEFVEPSESEVAEHTRPPRARDAADQRWATVKKQRPVSEPAVVEPGERVEPGPPDLHIVREQSPRRRHRVVLGAVAAVVLALAAAGAVAYGLTDSPAAQPSAPAAAPLADPIPDRVPTPEVSGAWTDDDEVTFTWTYERAQDGDYFRVRLVSDPEAPSRTVSEPTFAVAAGDTRPCVEVTVYRSNGRGSPEPGRACAP